MSVGFNPYLAFNNQIYNPIAGKNNFYFNNPALLNSGTHTPSNFQKPTYPEITYKIYEKPKLPDEYVLGETKDGQRIIDKNNVRRGTMPIYTTRNSCPYEMRPNFDKNSLIINGNFDDFIQGGQGDCYLLSSIYSINHTNKGKNLLKNNIQYNKDGSITVTFPGAIKAKNGYEKEGQGDKCAITGKYTITPAICLWLTSSAIRPLTRFTGPIPLTV